MSWKDILKTMSEEDRKKLMEDTERSMKPLMITRAHQKGALGDRWSSMKSHYILMSRDKPIIEFLQDIDDEKPPFDVLHTRNTFKRMVEEFMLKQGIGKFKEEYEKNKKEEYENAPRYSRFGEPPHK